VLDALFVALGGLMLYFGAEWLVGGAAGLARSFGVRPLVVGLTVVAYATSAPEIVVSGRAALAGRGALALGNVIGSNLANVGLIVGTVALVHPPRVHGDAATRDVPVLVVSTVLLGLVLADGVATRWEGAALLLGALGYTLWMLRSARPAKAGLAVIEEAAKNLEEREADAQAAGAPRVRGRVGLAALALVGLGVLVGGGDLFVRGASALATRFGVSERVIGLTIVAVGTSLPELATSFVAARRGHSEIAIGNVLGSNIFNILLVLGLSAAVADIRTSLDGLTFDLAALAGVTLLGAVFMRSARQVSRTEGAVLLLCYVGYLITLVLQSSAGGA
jgi:cation:H+ antiporter